MTLIEKINKIVTGRYVSLPEKTLNEINKSHYQMQAIDFLVDSETSCDIRFVGLESPRWSKNKVNKYSVALKNMTHSYSFEFFDSINNTERKKSLKYDFYSVLACLSYYTPDSFDDFCAYFGYEFKNETEYISTKQTHLACLDQQKNIHKLFTSNQLERLREIQ